MGIIYPTDKEKDQMLVSEFLLRESGQGTQWATYEKGRLKLKNNIEAVKDDPAVVQAYMEVERQNAKLALQGFEAEMNPYSARVNRTTQTMAKKLVVNELHLMNFGVKAVEEKKASGYFDDGNAQKNYGKFKEGRQHHAERIEEIKEEKEKVNEALESYQRNPNRESEANYTKKAGLSLENIQRIDAQREKQKQESHTRGMKDFIEKEKEKQIQIEKNKIINATAGQREEREREIKVASDPRLMRRYRADKPYYKNDFDREVCEEAKRRAHEEK